MDLGALLVIFSVMILAGIFLSRPFLQPRGAQDSALPAKNSHERERSELLAEYDRTLNALQELDFDHALGKIPAGEYPLQRAELITAGAETLTRLDALKKETPAGSVEARLEAAIAARRADAAREHAVHANSNRPVGVMTGEDPAEEMIASRRQARAEKSGGFCPHCGKPVQKSDRFCPRCGTTLSN